MMKFQRKKNSLVETVKTELATFQHPSLHKNLVELQALQHCVILDGQLCINLEMPFAWNSVFALLQQEKTQPLLKRTGAASIQWNLSYNISALHNINNLPMVKGVKNILAISSGKGGVGKSSCAVNIALALQAEGARVGILDADIYGPSIPTMLSTMDQRPTSPDGTHMVPVKAYQLLTNSIGYLAGDNEQSVIWRGPMASKVLLQLLRDTLWSELDYLIIDMPPGTGDIQITLAQSIPVNGAVIITTPQDIALLDAIKGITMFEKVKVPIIGVIENMSTHICTQCGYQEDIFGSHGAQKLLEQYHLALLGKLPLDINIRADLDCGQPTVIRRPDAQITSLYKKIASNIASNLYWNNKKTSKIIDVKQI